MQGEEIVILNAIKQLARGSNRVEDILISVAECCINAIEHGNMLQSEKSVGVDFTIHEDKYVVCVKDHGSGFTKCPPVPNIAASLLDEEPRGWGLYLIKSTTDEIRTGFDRQGQFYIELEYRRGATYAGRDIGASSNE